MRTRERGNSQASSDSGRLSGKSDETSEIIDVFMACHSKQQVVDALARFASRYFGCVTIYAVRGQTIERVAACADVDAPRRTSRGRMAMYTRCITTGKPYFGPIPLMDATDPRMQTLMAILPERCWVYPMAIGEQVDCLVYADAPKDSVARCTERFGFMVQKAVTTLRRLLIARLAVARIV